MRVLAYEYRESAQDKCPNWAAWGQQIDQIYEDIALPTEPGYRPQLDQLMVDNQTHPATVILVRELGVLGNTLEQVSSYLKTFEAAGTTVVPLDADPPFSAESIDLATQLAYLRLSSQVQIQQHSRRLRQGHARNRLKALPPPGKAPYGYRRGQERYLIDRSAAPVVTAFVNEFLLYGSLRGAVRFLEGRFGKRISVSTGRRWLTHAVYRGDLQYQDGGVLRDTHGAIISRDEAAQIDRLLRRNSQLPPRTAGASRSLAGLVSCQSCGISLVVSEASRRGRGKTYVYLRPVGCPRSPRCKAIPYDDALQAIITQICQTLPQAVAQLQQVALAPEADRHPPTSDRFQLQIEQKEAALAQLPGLVETGVLDADTADLRRYKLRSELAAILQQRSQLPPVNLQELSQSVSIPQFWLDLSESERRFFFREFIRDIQLVRDGQDWRIELILVF